MQYCTVLEIWDKMSFSVLFFLSFPTCLSSNSVKTTVAFLLLVACMMWNMIGMKSPCWNPPEFFHWFQDSAHLTFSSSVTPQIPKEYVLHVLELAEWIYLLVIWGQGSLNYTVGVILCLLDISLFAKLTSYLEFTTSFTVVLAEKVEKSLRIKIKFKKFYLGWFCLFF